MLFGTVGADPYLPTPDAIAALFADAAPSALALSSISPADDATNVAVNANVVLTFNNKVVTESVIVASEDGTIVAGAKTWDTACKVLTFNPTADLTNNTVYIVTIGGVADIYGQSLAAAVKNFTTVV